MELPGPINNFVTNVTNKTSGLGASISSGLGQLTSGSFISKAADNLVAGFKNSALDAIGRNIPKSFLDLFKAPVTNVNSLGSGSSATALHRVIISTPTVIGVPIVFPYTPDIKQDFKAIYKQTQVVHSNYPVYSFASSAGGEISITGKFTAQTSAEADMVYKTIKALQVLIKMQTSADTTPGAPPPVCTLNGFNGMYKDVPVVISNFNLSLPSDVDYISTLDAEIPTLMTINVSMYPMYSRAEILKKGLMD